MPFKETCPCMGPPKSSTNFGVVHFFSPATFITPSSFVRPEKPVSSSRPNLISDATRAAGVKAGRDQRPPEGLGLDGAEHAATLGVYGMPRLLHYDLLISCLMICCLPFYSPQLLSSD
jgi:hypothetical protein